MTELDGLIGAEEKVINSKKKVDENVVSPLHLYFVKRSLPWTLINSGGLFPCLLPAYRMSACSLSIWRGGVSFLTVVGS